MTDASTGPGEGVHRLVDMVVEEVSLVDRAANQRRFLIVKRDDPMDDSTQTEVTTEVTTTTADGGSENGAGETEDTPLGAAVAALESLADIVALLSDLGGDAVDPRLGTLATQLSQAADQILSRIGIDSSEDESVPVEARAPAKEQAPQGDATEAKTKLRANLEATKAAVQRLATRCKNPAARKSEPAPESTLEVEGLTKSFASLSASFQSLSELVNQQQQRLGRIEKQCGLPNSAAPAERIVKATPEEVGWPLDLNKPMDRESVDKAVSFHDL